jgi:hypothetical protein
VVTPAVAVLVERILLGSWIRFRKTFDKTASPTCVTWIRRCNTHSALHFSFWFSLIFSTYVFISFFILLFLFFSFISTFPWYLRHKTLWPYPFAPGRSSELSSPTPREPPAGHRPSSASHPQPPAPVPTRRLRFTSSISLSKLPLPEVSLNRVSPSTPLPSHALWFENGGRNRPTAKLSFGFLPWRTSTSCLCFVSPSLYYFHSNLTLINSVLRWDAAVTRSFHRGYRRQPSPPATFFSCPATVSCAVQ